jgi:hypothetical protein
VVADKNTRIGPVPRVSERAGAEESVVEEVAEEDGVPLIRRIRLERFEQPLDVAVDVSDDQDGQIVSQWRSIPCGIRRPACPDRTGWVEFGFGG